MDNLNIIVKLYFGSHLYGTNTKDSDLDYKGIFLPTKRELILGNIPKSYSYNTKKDKEGKNTKDDKDIEIYSLHYFIKLACEGQTVAIDMLHAPDNMILEKNWIWDLIVHHKEKFYTKNLKAFIGYARRQASKYGIKGSRLAAAKKVLLILEQKLNQPHIGTLKLKDFWDDLPEGEHSHHLPKNINGIRQYQICGKFLQETISVEYAYNIIEKFYNNYGKRARQAEQNLGVDWKALQHAVRAAIQVKQLLTENIITFPLKDADYLLKIKNGELDYNTVVAPYLESLMEEVEILSEKSKLPSKVNRKFWDDFIVNCYDL